MINKPDNHYKMNKPTTRFIAALLMLLLSVASANAVLKEKNFEQTLNVLRAELQRSYLKQKAILNIYEQRTKEQHDQLVLTLQKCNQISLILYSQKDGFTFDMAYACQQATEMYQSLNADNMPYEKVRIRLKSEVDRYDLLINSLENLPPALNAKPRKSSNTAEPDTTVMRRMQERLDSIAKANGEEPFVLDEYEQKARGECLIYAKALRNNLARLMTKLEKDSRHYERVTNRVGQLNEYAQSKYEMLRRSIFNNRGDSYLKILFNFNRMLWQVRSEIDDKYVAFDDSGAAAQPAAANADDAQPASEQRHTHNSRSQWRGMIIPITSLFILFYVLVSTILSQVIIRWLLPRRIRETEEYRQKKPVLLLACGFIIFMITVAIAKSFITNNFLIMAIGLLLEFSWLVVFILLSLLFRLTGGQIKEGVKQYMPFLIMAFVVILFRIVFIPNNLVNLIFPPILVVFTLWQASTLRRRKVAIPGSDMIYTVISLVAMVVACVVSLIGYTLLAVEIMIWWTFQLACIQTITFLFDLCKIYETSTLLKRVQKVYKEKNNGRLPTDKLHKTIDDLKAKIAATTSDDERKALNGKLQENEKKLASLIYTMRDNIKKKMLKGDYIESTWMFDLVTQAVIPMLAVVSVLGSLYMAADMFDMTDLFFKYLSIDFISSSFMQLSIEKLCYVISLFFFFKYINYAGHAIYREIKNKRNEMFIAQEKKKLRERGHQDEEVVLPNTNITLANNIITLLVWGSYFIMILYMLNVPKSGITIITTGLATGMGFAMKDLLENFFYGLSLMTGRIRIGDYIECDGIAGKVESITYQSTQIVTRDGCVIAFLNSQLFSKNFKNLTRNHKYEMVKIPVGVAYGTNVQQVRELLVARINQIIDARRDKQPNLVKKGTSVSVAFSGFGDSSVDLVVVVWVLVEEKVGFVGEANEAIYNVLNENNIEIPFPQADIHIRDTVNLPITNK
ncbi:MAG: mechanosensitive ion channel domain-containing protein [Muribaculaceae bacterium]